MLTKIRRFWRAGQWNERLCSCFLTDHIDQLGLSLAIIHGKKLSQLGRGGVGGGAGRHAVKPSVKCFLLTQEVARFWCTKAESKVLETGVALWFSIKLFPEEEKYTVIPFEFKLNHFTLSSHNHPRFAQSKSSIHWCENIPLQHGTFCSIYWHTLPCCSSISVALCCSSTLCLKPLLTTSVPYPVSPNWPQKPCSLQGWFPVVLSLWNPFEPCCLQTSLMQ